MKGYRPWRGRLYAWLDTTILAHIPLPWKRSVVRLLLAATHRQLNENERRQIEERLLLHRVLIPAPTGETLPKWLLHDMKDLAMCVDPQLDPYTILTARPASMLVPTHWTDAGRRYRNLAARLAGRDFDTVILVPWLKRGGADLGAIHHASACVEDFGQRTLVIATEPGDSPWARRLPPETCFLAAGAELSGLATDALEPELVLARLLLQLAPSRIHVINSHTGWRTFENFGRALSQRSRLFTSLYCDELTVNGTPVGLAQRHLATTHTWLDAVICDNTVAPARWVSGMGLPQRLFHVAHFPAPHDIPPQKREDIGKRLLWASRFEWQKRPELLLDLVKNLPEFEWDIYGEPTPDTKKLYKKLLGLPNVHAHGSYEKFANTIGPQHLAYVYTTRWDGLPNVLLEAASAAIPLIAPDVGGIRDLVPTELLLPENAGVYDYVQAIRRLQATKEEGRKQLTTSRVASFTREAFIEALRAVPGYATRAPR